MKWRYQRIRIDDKVDVYEVYLNSKNKIVSRTEYPIKFSLKDKAQMAMIDADAKKFGVIDDPMKKEKK